MGNVRIGYSRNMARKIISDHLIIKPPIDVYKIAIYNGLSIQEIDINDSKWSGNFYRTENTIAVNSRHHLNRKRFTVAHELGHYALLHESNEFEDIIGFEGSFSTGIESDDLFLNDIEREANEFASELLIPLALIKKDYEKNPQPKELAKLYCVSEVAMFVSLLKHRIFK